MALWEQILVGVLVLLVLLWFRPGIREGMRRSREAQERDWNAVLLPVGLVVLFVLLMIWGVRA